VIYGDSLQRLNKIGLHILFKKQSRICT